MWPKVAKFKGAEYFRKALYLSLPLVLSSGVIDSVSCRCFYSLFWLGQGVTRVGILCSVSMFCISLLFGRVWFSIRVSCLLLSLIENYT